MERQYGIKNLMAIIISMTGEMGQGLGLPTIAQAKSGKLRGKGSDWGSGYSPSHKRDQPTPNQIADRKDRAQAIRDRRNNHRLACVAMGGFHYHA